MLETAAGNGLGGDDDFAAVIEAVEQVVTEVTQENALKFSTAIS